MLNYPLKFRPILKEKIWGGKKLTKLLNKESDSENLGESWEISGVVNDISVVEKGGLKGKSLRDLLKKYKSDLLGKNVYHHFGQEFPLLIKYIDAKTDLSVQLHPKDELAKIRHQSFGKTEMWYIMQADENSEINVGFKHTISREEYIERLEKKRIVDLLHFEKVKKGDSFFINSGKVHAIGAGVLLAEIQQTSDITYRIYDWNRLDANGNARELHTFLALDAIDFEKKEDFKLTYDIIENQSSNLVRCQYFTTNYLPINGKITKDYTKIDSFIIYLCMEGQVEIEVKGNVERMEQGQTVLIPAINKKVSISGKNATLLEVYIG